MKLTLARFMSWISRLRGWLLGRRAEQEFAEEVDSHLAMHADELERRGLAREDAERAARLTFGGITQVKETLRDRRGLPSLDAIGQDVRYALRQWRRRPAFVATAIGTLALGIGATTAIFSVVDGVLLRPLPFPNPDRLVAVYIARPDRPPTLNRLSVPWPVWRDLDTQTRAFEQVGAWTGRSQALGGDRPEVVSTMLVSSSFLPMLGLSPAAGRFFTPGEDSSDSGVALIGHGLWQRRFGGRPDIIGTNVMLTDTTGDIREDVRVIVGVIPPDFTFDRRSPDIAVPISSLPVDLRTPRNHTLSVVARLATGTSIESAQVDADPWVRRHQPDVVQTARLVPLAEDQLAHTTRPLLILLCGAALLLAVAGSNVAGLLIGDAYRRRHEVSIRTALGGSRRRLLRQFWIEQLLLALAATAFGVLLAVWLTPVIVALAPERLPRLDQVTIDARILVFALTSGVLTTLCFGMASALALVSASPVRALSEGGRDETQRRSVGQRTVIAIQMGLAVVLLVGASLFGETMLRLRAEPLGFDPANLAAVTLRTARERGSTRLTDPLELESRAARTTALIDRLASIPGVTSVAASSTPPFVGNLSVTAIKVDGRWRPGAQRHIVTDRYFDTMGMPVLRGRGFDTADVPGAHVALVSRQFEVAFLGGDAVGKHFALQGLTSVSEVDHTVIGVVPDAKQLQLADPMAPAFYVLNRQMGTVSQFLVRSSSGVGRLRPVIQQTMQEFDPQLLVLSFETMDRLLERSIIEERYRAILSVVFSATALVLAALGLHGLAARRIAERHREIGVRMALGARGADVARLVLRDGLTLVGLGLAGGLPLAFAVSRGLDTLLFGVSAADPRVFLVSSAVLAAAAILAMAVPARRASRIDPMRALRG